MESTTTRWLSTSGCSLHRSINHFNVHLLHMANLECSLSPTESLQAFPRQQDRLQKLQRAPKCLVERPKLSKITACDPDWLLRWIRRLFLHDLLLARACSCHFQFSSQRIRSLSSAPVLVWLLELFVHEPNPTKQSLPTTRKESVDPLPDEALSLSDRQHAIVSGLSTSPVKIVRKFAP